MFCEKTRKHVSLLLMTPALTLQVLAEQLGPEGAIVANITLFAVLIYELVGPMLTKIALLKAGDIKPEEKVSAREMAKLEMENKKSEEAQN